MDNILSIIDEKPLIRVARIPEVLYQDFGISINRSTVRRWLTIGARGKKLESELIGGRRFTSGPALDRFLRHSSTSRKADKSRGANSSSHGQRQPFANADAFLEAEGA